MNLASPLAPITVMTVDDHPLLLEGIASVIACEPGMKLVAEACNGQEAIARFREFRPDVTLMDIQMPVMNGVDATMAIRREFPDARIVVLTTYQGDAHALRAIRAGAAGYMLKNALRNELLDTIRLIHCGRRIVPREIAMELAEHLSDDELSCRETEVLQLIASGLSNKGIAAVLFISEETVKVHVKNILSKMMANDRTHAVTIAFKRGILNVDRHIQPA